MPARSIRWRPASCRSRSAKPPRPCRSSRTAASATASISPGAPRPRPTMPRARWSRPPTFARPRPTFARMLPRFTGTILQRPPAFSAIKVDGERAYDLARAGEAVELAERPVTIGELTLLSHTAERSSFEMACEKGTYVRVAGPRPRRSARHARPRHRAAPHRGRRLHRKGRRSNRDDRSVRSIATPCCAGRRPRCGTLPELPMTADDAALIRNGGAVLLRGAAAPIAARRSLGQLQRPCRRDRRRPGRAVPPEPGAEGLTERRSSLSAITCEILRNQTDRSCILGPGDDRRLATS